MRAPSDHVSDVPTPYAVVCVGLLSDFSCGTTYLTEKGYIHQMRFADMGWKCPICGADAFFDDENFEEF